MAMSAKLSDICSGRCILDNPDDTELLKLEPAPYIQDQDLDIPEWQWAFFNDTAALF